MNQYIQSLKDDIHKQVKELHIHPYGYKISLLQSYLNCQYFKYVKKMKEDKVRDSIINKFQSDCSFSLKNTMEDEYIKYRNEVCANVLSNICLEHCNEYNELTIENFWNNNDIEIQRIFNINCNIIHFVLI